MSDARNPPANDPSVPGAWPAAPACYGWLALDRRGRWLLRGETIAHPGLLAVIGDNYVAGPDGAWYFRNGPQRVYVDLECAPWVLRLTPAGLLQTHTGRLDAIPRAAWVDESGTVLIDTTLGAGVLDGADLPAFVAGLTRADGEPAQDADIEALLGRRPEAGAPLLCWRHGAGAIPVGCLAGDTAPARLGFVRTPRPS